MNHELAYANLHPVAASASTGAAARREPRLVTNQFSKGLGDLGVERPESSACLLWLSAEGREEAS